MQSARSKLPSVFRGFAVATWFGLGAVVAKRGPLVIPRLTGVAWPALFAALMAAALALFEHPYWSRLNMIGHRNLWLDCSDAADRGVSHMVSRAAVCLGVAGLNDGTAVTDHRCRNGDDTISV